MNNSLKESKTSNTVLDSYFNIKTINLSKSFGGTKALDNINIELNSKEIHGLVGQNGAGKSTLGKIIGGYHKFTEGQLIINNKNIDKWSPKLALDNGIAMIHQELALVPRMTVFENIFLGIEKNNFGILEKKNFNLFYKLEENIGFGLNPKEIVGNLRIADQQKVEIMRALARDAKVIIMDEPTSSLTKDEIERLHSLMKKLRLSGYLIIYVSHFLDAILEVCNNVTILRDGKLIRTNNIDRENKESLVEAMLGKSAEIAFPDKPNIDIKTKKTLLKIDNIKTNTGLRDISINISNGEIVGLLGLVGSGRTETLRAIFGADKLVKGKINYLGNNINLKNPKEAINQGIMMIPEDRRKLGLVFSQNTKSNITITNLNRVSNLGWLKSSKENNLVRKLIEQIDIKPNNINGNIAYYSGGNQQKVLFAKWMFDYPKLILLDEPTRGVDVGAKRKIYELIVELASKGVGILIVSSELEEVMGLSDRAYLIKNGKTIDEIVPVNTTMDKVLYSLFGAKKEEVQTNGTK